MLEKIYTIPVNEAFDACALTEIPDAAAPAAEPANTAEASGAAETALTETATEAMPECPFCRLYQKLQEDELDIILGASMMDPDIRIRTNQLGFCQTHYRKMLGRRNRLGMALMLESHLNTLREEIDSGGLGSLLRGKETAALERIGKLEQTCYVCERINASMGKMVENAVYLWESERDFREKLKRQPYFCLPHYRQYLAIGKEKMGRRDFPDFRNYLAQVVCRYFDALRADTSLFIKKFDYRYEAEPWGNSKTAVERAVKFLKGDTGKDESKN